MIAEAALQRSGQGDDAVFPALRIVDLNGTLAEIEVFHSEFEGFALAQSAAIHRLAEQLPWIFQLAENASDLLPCQDSGRAAGTGGGATELDLEVAHAVDFSGQEDHCIEGLLLRCRGYPPLKRQVVQVMGGSTWIEILESRDP